MNRREPIIIRWVCDAGRQHQQVLRLPRIEALAAVISLMFRECRTVGRA